jgi:dGTPase
VSITLDWERLLTSQRRSSVGGKRAKPPAKTIEYRTEIERDYDRILFSTPVRRLADKTQVFPLEKNDSVRNRFTHSHEVSTLARSVGVALVYHTPVFKGISDASRNVPAMLAAVGLAHDLGNPPFGHQGEKAIAGWFRENRSEWCEANGINLDRNNSKKNGELVRRRIGEATGRDPDTIKGLSDETIRRVVVKHKTHHKKQ